MKRHGTKCPRCGVLAVYIVRGLEYCWRTDLPTVEFADEFSQCRECHAQYYTKNQSLAHTRSLREAMR